MTDNKDDFPDLEILNVLNLLEEYGQREEEPKTVLGSQSDQEV